MGVVDQPPIQAPTQAYETTSSTLACTVAAGPAGLDTGQWAAKALMSVPLSVIEVSIASLCARCVAKDVLRQHVGFSLSRSVLFCCRHEADHNWKHGTRIGEASHPGPGGGGSRATASR